MKNRSMLQHILLFAAFSLALSLTGCYSGAATAGSKGAINGAEPRDARPEAVKEESPNQSSLPNAQRLVTEYNNRNFGSPGWRTVYLELVTDGSVTRTFTVINLWKKVGRETKTLFLLREPRGLSGTNYLLQEDSPDSKASDMKVYLFLPSGQRQVLEIAPSNFNEGLLGSDFTYTDLRMKLPVRDYSYRVIREAVLHNEPVWVLEAEPVSEAARRATSWAVAHFYLARNFQFMLGADYYASPEDVADSSRASKRMRVEKFEQREGVWTATRMNMFGPANRYSVLSLQDARFAVSDIDSAMFLASSLPSLADRIHQGWSPATSAKPPVR
ncbi:MAG TPA: outer membrane lipoprotein-sorting protein [Blastocatellia bacterium]|nr:outer membrane lipoprotein-sorting protein [Blastocatellia bacterium]